MKIIGIVGSPRGTRGNTGRLLEIVFKGARAAGAETEMIAIRGPEIKPCKACNVCHKKGLCPQKDRFNEVKDKILEADGLLLASPDYIFNVSAQLKAFLDRCCSPVHCLAFTGKYGAAVVTSSGGDGKPIADYLNHFLMTTGATPVGSVFATMSAFSGTEYPETIRKAALALGEKLVRAWKDHEIFPDRELQAAAFHDRMRNLMLRRKNEWPYEYQFWKKYRGLK